MFEPYGILGLVIAVVDVLVILSVLAGNASKEHKILWSVVILLLPVVGLLLYFFIGRSPQDA